MTTQRSMWRPPIPFPEAVARKLALENRWTHDLKRHWTVAHHLVLCQELAARDKLLPITQLWILVHDAHEAWCRDVPSFAITSEQRAFMCEEQVRLHDAWSIPEPNAAAELIIREYDLRARTAEAYTAVEDATRERWLSGNNKTEGAPTRREADVHVVGEILRKWPGALDWWFRSHDRQRDSGECNIEIALDDQAAQDGRDEGRYPFLPTPALIADEWLRRYAELRSKCALDRDVADDRERLFGAAFDSASTPADVLARAERETPAGERWADHVHECPQCGNAGVRELAEKSCPRGRELLLALRRGAQ